MSANTYSVYVEVGGYSWGVEGNDTPGDVAATYGLADPITIGQQWPSSDLAPNVQPESATATVSIIAPNGATYGNMSLGDPLVVEFYSQAAFSGGIVRSFYGRVADIQAQPHDLGVLYTISGVDYLADLQERTVGLVAWPAERVTDRVQRILSEAGWPGLPSLPPAFSSGDHPSVAARSASAATAYDVLIHTLDQWVVQPGFTELGHTLTAGVTSRLSRPILVQQITNRRLATSPVRLEWISNGRRVEYSPPGRLASLGGVLTIQMLAANNAATSPTGSWILDAGNMNRAATYAQQKGSGTLSNLTVTTSVGSSSYDYALTSAASMIPTTNVGAILETELANSPTGTDPNGGFLIQAYLVPTTSGNVRPDPIVPWTVGTLQWEAWHVGTGWAIPTLGELVVVCRMDSVRNPAARTWIAGTVSSWQLVVAGGRPVVQLELVQQTNVAQANNTQLGTTLGVISWGSPQIGGWTFAQLPAASDTFSDYALVRGS